MGNLFLTLYFLFFGAVLSAEISTHHFSGLHLYTTTQKPFGRLTVRVFFLIVIRLVYLGWAYSELMHCPSFGQNLPFFFQPIICAVLSLPIVGLAQLSYRFEPPPVIDPPKQKFPSGTPTIVYSYAHCVPSALLSIFPAILEISARGLRKSTKKTGLDRKTIRAILNKKKVKASTLAKVVIGLRREDRKVEERMN